MKRSLTVSIIAMCLYLARTVMPLVVTLGMVAGAQAQPASDGPWTLQGGLGLSATVIDHEAAEAETLPGGGLGVHLFFSPYLYEVVTVRAELGLTALSPLCFNDAADCAVWDREDAFYLLSGALSAGMRSPPLTLGPGAPHLYVGAGAGYEGGRAWQGRRHCVNCVGAPLDLRAGFFAEPLLELHVTGGLGVGMAYRAYLAPSDLQGRFIVRLFASSP